MPRRLIQTALWLLLFSWKSFAAESSFADYSRVLRSWGVDEGLLGGRVDCVEQTPDGYLWAGTSEGLFRLDGRKFEYIDTGPADPPQWGGISNMQLDRDGALWMRRADGKTIHYAQGEISIIEHAPKLFFQIQMSAHPEGGILIANNYKKDVTLTHLTTEKSIDLSKPFEEHIIGIHVTPEGRIWLGRNEQALAEFRDGKLIPPPSDLTKSITTFLEHSDGSILAVGRYGIFQWDGSRWKEHTIFPNALPQHPGFLKEDHDGRIWYGGRTKDRYVLEPDGRVTKLKTGRHALPGVIQDVILDSEGDLWFASFSGLFQARYMPFVTWKTPDEIPTERVVNINTSPDGSIWFTGFGGICKLPPGGMTPTLEFSRPTNEISNCLPDGNGNLWLVTGPGYFNYQKAGEQTGTPVLPGKKRIFHVYTMIDDKNVLWASAHTGLFFCDPTKSPLEFELASGKNGLPPSPSFNVRHKENNDLLATFRGEGIYRRPAGATEWEPVSPPDDTIAGESGHIDQDREGRVWGSARRPEVFSCWLGKIRHSITYSELGFNDVYITGLTADDIGNLWISTRDDGVATMNCDGLLAKMKDSSLPLKVTWFDKLSGLGSKGGSFTSHSMKKSPDGRIWVATNGGLSAIQPKIWQEEIERASLQDVTIEACSSDGQDLPISSQVKIPAGTSQVEIQLGVLSFGFPGEINYRYRLLGYADQWIDGADANTIAFQKLPPGSYHFEVVASNRFGTWNPNPTRLAIAVLPHWWQRSELQLLFALLILVIIWLIVRARMNALRSREALHADFSRQLISSQEEERKRIAHELHDGLGQSLLVVKNLAAMGQQSHPEESTATTQFTSISGSAADALAEVRTISRALRPPELDRLGITEAIHATLDRVTESSEISVDSHIENLDNVLAPEFEIGIFRILQETLNNIIKHAEAKSITVTTSLDKKDFRMTVKDDGKGFLPDSTESGVGLQSIKERTHLMGGQWQIHSSPGEGTTAGLSIPLSGTN